MVFFTSYLSRSVWPWGKDAQFEGTSLYLFQQIGDRALTLDSILITKNLTFEQ